MNAAIETHPLPPFLPENAKVLMLGSFPPPRMRWKMDFYYPNIQNDMWRVMGGVFFGNPARFLLENGKGFREAALRAFLADTGIALSDTAYKVRRLAGNASDKSLQIIETMDIAGLLAVLPDCRTIVTTGELATATMLSLLPGKLKRPKVGGFVQADFANRPIRLYRLPSTSRAYPLPLTDKIAAYQRFFTEIQMIKI